MAEERAIADHPFWGYRWGVIPAPGRRYLDWRYSKCAPWVIGRRVLEVPSGEGIGLAHLGAASEVVCLDYEAAALANCAQQAGRSVETVCGDMGALPFGDGSFDVVTSLEGLEHLDKAHGVRFLAEAFRVLKDGGLLLLSCPLCSDGRHSGNAFHRHEWKWPDLEEILQHGFEILDFEFRQFFSSIVWCAARRRMGNLPIASWSAALGEQGKRTLVNSQRQLDQWVNTTWRDVLAPMHATGEPHFLPTCFAVLAAECCGDWKSLGNRREGAAEILRRSQSAADGLFEMGPIRAEDLTSHNADYLKLQATYFAVHALDALGSRPEYPIYWVQRLFDSDELRSWLDLGPWNNPWLHSNNVMFALTFLQLYHEQTGDGRALSTFDEILNYLDERQDPASGLWQPNDRVDMENAVYAAYHFFPYYFWRGVRPRYVEQIIDSTLSIQKADGLFGTRIGGGACEDLDAVHTLVMMNLVSDHRAGDVRTALERCFWRLLQIQHADGGFPNSVWSPPRRRFKRRIAEALGIDLLLGKRRRTGVGYHAGWKKLEYLKDSSDMWAAWFRPLALRLIAEHYPDLAGPPPTGSYRTLPGLGWHDAVAIRNSVTRPATALSNGTANR